MQALPRLTGRQRPLAVIALLLLVGVVTALLVGPLTRPRPNAPDSANPAVTRDAELLAAMSRLREASTTPARIHLDHGFPDAVSVRVPVAGATVVERATDFLASYHDLYGLAGSTSRLMTIKATGLSDGAAVVAFGQRYHGLEVYGGNLHVILQGSDALGSIGGLRPDLAIATTPSIDAEAALEIAVGSAPQAGRSASELVVIDPSLLGADGAALLPDGQARLGWRVWLAAPRHEEVIVDAQTGEVLLRLARREAATIHVGDMLGMGQESQTGCLFDPPDAASSDPEALAARTFFQATLDWYEDMFGRLSWNGLGAPVDVNVNALFLDNAGMPMLNAHWQPMCDIFEFATGLVLDDVVAHEFTHAVVGSRAGGGYGLEYWGMSGALNESYADVMGFLQTGDPIHGDTPLRNGFRDLQDPSRSKPAQPVHTNDFVVLQPTPDDLAPDNLAVHRNSGIPNRVAFRIARGDGFVGIGDDRTAQLYYEALALLPNTATFEWQRVAVETAAVIQGFKAAEICEIGRIFDASGIGFPNPSCEDVFPDTDGDAIPNHADNCPDVANPTQANLDLTEAQMTHDSLGDACDPDPDGDKVDTINATGGSLDNCPWVYNPSQVDDNANGIGALCDGAEDGDLDDDLVPDAIDSCPNDFNPRPQPDADRDGEGDACDPDLDEDGVGTNGDNCPDDVNADQADGDDDGLGDACDPCPTAADASSTWSALFYFDAEGSVQTELLLEVPDSDDDGTPDACDAVIGGVGAVLQVLDSLWAATDGVAEVKATLRSEAAGSVAIDLPICLPDCAALARLPDSCVDARVLDADVATRVSVVDERGHTVARDTDGAAERLEFAASGGMDYSIVLERLDGASDNNELRIAVSPCPTTSPPATDGPVYVTDHAAIDLVIDGDAHRLEGGTCDVVSHPALEGRWLFTLTIGAPAFDTGVSEDYFALGIVLPTRIPAGGLYSGLDVFAAGSAGNHLFELANLSATLDDAGVSGQLIATGASDGAPVSAEFHC